VDDHKLVGEIPFDGLSNDSSLYQSRPYIPLYELRPFDVSSPLIVDTPPAKLPRQRINQHGIPGDVEEMLHLFDACLQVGKLDRAALVLKRFKKVGLLADHDLMQLHNRFLRARVEQIQETPGLDKAEDLHKWYELEIRSKRLPETAETIAFMLKASLLTSHGSRLNRLVDRYMGMVPGEAGLDVLYMSDILTDQDLATITTICPTYNLLPEDIPVESAAMENAALNINIAETSISTSTPIPEVLSTPQKGKGLEMLKQTLSLFQEIPEGREISSLPYSQRREIQSRLEKDCVDAAVARWREDNQALLKMGLNTSVATASLSSRLYEWQEALERRIAQELELCEQSELALKKNSIDLERCLYGPILSQSTPSRLAAVTILTTLSSLAMHGADKGVPLTVVVGQVSKIAEEDVRAQQRAKEKSSATAKAGRVRARMNLRRSNGLQTVASAENKPTAVTSSETTVPLASLDDKVWPINIRSKIGAVLLSALMETAKVTAVKEHPETKTLLSQVQPAFSHANQLKRGKKIGMIIPNRTLVELMKREPRGDFLARQLPMVVEPEPWSKFEKGGFIEYPASLIRIKNGEKDQKIYTEAALARGDMDQVTKGLDVLGRTAWQINKPVFNVMLEAWNKGDAIADIPALNPNISIPPEPDSSADPMQRRLWIKAVKAAENEKSGLHSVRCFMNLQLEIARAFRDQTFYFPHNIDFRGRAYPIPTYLNHMGADHVRGLLRFAKGKELGETGLRWLKIHTANVFGYDKASLMDRENFARDNMDKIRETVEDPLGGSRWWLTAEDPWQFLAACYELRAALDLPDPTKYISHLPVHQDGTCNGLQHYAALGGDEWGARQVNLLPGDRPADVYSAVAELVNKSVAEDVESGNPFAEALSGKITRKVVKQTVMTNVYGVTFAGAKKQVVKQLDALYPSLQAETGLDPILLASYTATKIFKALSTMFRGAHDIQYWLGEIGGRVCRALMPDQLQDVANDSISASTTARGSKSKAKITTDELLGRFRSTIIWTTPLRMPVIQPYRKNGTRVVSTCLQDLTLAVPERTDPVHRRKQLQAFPPNFIHSLDASHMILSALQCDEIGLTFAAVHDSFWTHAADVDSMNEVIRDAFIRIHREDVIGRLAAEFNARYKGSIYLAKLNQGLDVEKKITAFRKENRMSLKEELLLEKQRQDLLNSSNPEEVERGLQMVTPGSIYEEMAANQDLSTPEDIGDSGLGSIPVQEEKALEKQESKTCSAGEDDSLAGEDIEAAESTEDMDLAESTEDRLKSLIGTGHFAIQMSSTPKTKPREKPTIQIWLPLTLPSIPEKGDFDVRRLKASKYFFS
jgi:DNA-directed RNA polymerase